MPRRHNPVKHTPYIPANFCRNKRKFASKHAASQALDQQELFDMRLTLKVYKCPYCNNWHLTRSKAS